MRQHSWDAVLLGAVTLIAVLAGPGDQKVTAAAPQTHIAVAQSDSRQATSAKAPAAPRR